MGASNTEMEQSVIMALKSESFISTLQKLVLDTVKSAVSDVLKDMNTKVNDLEKENKHLKEENIKINKKCDRLEQYSRRNNVRIFGVPESLKENVEEVVTGIFKKFLSVELPEFAVDRCHRVGAIVSGRHRPILVKFSNYKFKYIVFTKKRLLKGSRIVINDDLTSARVRVLKDAKKKFGASNVWARDGIIFAKSNNKLCKLEFLDDLLPLSTPDDFTINPSKGSQSTPVHSLQSTISGIEF